MLDIVCGRYAGFGPPPAHEKLLEPPRLRTVTRDASRLHGGGWRLANAKRAPAPATAFAVAASFISSSSRGATVVTRVWFEDWGGVLHVAVICVDDATKVQWEGDL